MTSTLSLISSNCRPSMDISSSRLISIHQHWGIISSNGKNNFNCLFLLSMCGRNLKSNWKRFSKKCFSLNSRKSMMAALSSFNLEKASISEPIASVCHPILSIPSSFLSRNATCSQGQLLSVRKGWSGRPKINPNYFKNYSKPKWVGITPSYNKETW